MAVLQHTLVFRTSGRGTYELTEQVRETVRTCGIRTGMVSLFCQHTSCSLVTMENADPTARRDLEAWLDRLVAEDDPLFEHTLEGPDDMPAHIKMALTRTSETLPFSNGSLLLGTWQGLFLWEHRLAPHARRIVVTIFGD